ELHFNNRPHPVHGRSDRQADHGILADRRIDDPAGELLGQIFRRLERAAEGPHVLTVNEHSRVFGQRPRLRFANGFQVSDTHPFLKSAVLRAPPPGAATTARASPPCTGPASARVEPWRRLPQLFGSLRCATVRPSARPPSRAAT